MFIFQLLWSCLQMLARLKRMESEKRRSKSSRFAQEKTCEGLPCLSLQKHEPSFFLSHLVQSAVSEMEIWTGNGFAVQNLILSTCGFDRSNHLLLCFFDFEESMQLPDARGVSHFSQGFGFNLTDAFAGDTKLFADFFKRA